MELQKIFYSPIAWLVLIAFSIQTGMQLMQLINMTVVNSDLGYSTSNLTRVLFTGQSGILNRMQMTLYLYIPLLTMGLFSQEFSSGSIKLLYSAPISNIQIVVGKFVSMMIFGLALVIILLLAVSFGCVVIREFELSLVITAVLGLYLLICAYAAVGLFVSSLTSYQIVAAIGTFAILFILGQVGSMWQDVDFVRDITYWLSINGRSDTLIRGLICSEDILYFILVSGLFIAFTVLCLKGIREKSPKHISALRYIAVFIIISVIGYISTVPSLMMYHDATRTKLNTLTLNSQDVVSHVEGKINVTTYVNIFDDNFWYGAPSNQKYDMSRYDQYLRFHPDMELNYKYYYALPTDKNELKSHNERFAGLTLQQALEKASNISEVSSGIFKPAEHYTDEINLKSENNRFVTKITNETGKVAYLRVYNDMKRVPGESEITAALKKLTMDLPVVGFVTGHSERDVNDFGSRGYLQLAKEKNYRYSLINNGFDFKEFNLSKPVEESIDILIVSDSKKGFSDKELKHLNSYIDRGGNLVIAADLNRQFNMNPLVEHLGVEFIQGQVVEHNKGYGMDLVTSVATKESYALAYQFETISDEKPVMMPGAVGIKYKEIDGFNYTRVLTSDLVENISAIDSAGSWNELQTRNYTDSIAKYNPEKEEILGPITTALALTRNVGDKEQRIMILGDADCISNGELSTNRNGYRAQNFNMGTGMFYWLSNNEVPIDVRRPNLTDNKIYVTKSKIPFLNIVFKVIVPLVLLVSFLLIWFRRKGR
ncbi:Gldg family protein [Aestuariibaculum sp. M13]|uniref:Gldg family protein n=1 Tax=Aestuariibaculum sp. M13 TaxID=2967132 RepID=UPI002159E15A|nr:Gldg family protein [Aestuariibaculum sp. M13]MCR8668955.1 Gldg family protein [Aestuariibaculum sp. M13]